MDGAIYPCDTLFHGTPHPLNRIREWGDKYPFMSNNFNDNVFAISRRYLGISAQILIFLFIGTARNQYYTLIFIAHFVHIL